MNIAYSLSSIYRTLVFFMFSMFIMFISITHIFRGIRTGTSAFASLLDEFRKFAKSDC